MTYEQFLKLLPYLVTLASLIVTAILGIANYRISHDKASLEKERFAHDKAMVYWNEKVTVYSNMWAAVTTAYEGYLSWQDIADDPSEALRKWAVITVINDRKGSPDGNRKQRKRNWLAAGDPTQDAIDDLQQRVRDDPDYWLGWLTSERKPNFEELEAEVRKQFFFLAPLHREIVEGIFGACNAIRYAKTTAEFTTAYYDHLELIKVKYRELNNEIDKTFYPAESTEMT